MKRIVPGQQWRWIFDVGDGWWPVQRVTERGRLLQTFNDYVTLERGNLLTVVTVDDPGPAGTLTLDEFGLIKTLNKRWHVALFKSTLIWVDNEWFDGKALELVNDVG